MHDLDLLGIGVGPANLSLAALADPVTDLRCGFLDQRPEFNWHPGLMFPDSQLTVTFFRDLVTLVDPTNRFSFMNFLVSKGRAFRFLEGNGLTPSRLEFEQYYRWAAAQLDTIHWGARVESVGLADDGFQVTYGRGETITARNLVIGSGSEPRLPAFAKAFEGSQVLHSGSMTVVRPQWKGLRVLVVGAGQSGAEIVNHLLGDESALPASLTWTSPWVGFQPLDDSPFTNEWFSAGFVGYFNGLPPDRRAKILQQQRAAGGDGITDALNTAIYRRLYHLDHVLGSGMRHRLLPGRRAVDMRRDGDHLVIDLHDENRDSVEFLPADLVIFCTGYRNCVPEYLKPIRDQLAMTDGVLQVRDDYSLDLGSTGAGRIYVQGFAENSHGINDTLLSLMAWRSAGIINAVAGREIYCITADDTTVTWE